MGCRVKSQAFMPCASMPKTLVVPAVFHFVQHYAEGFEASEARRLSKAFMPCASMAQTPLFRACFCFFALLHNIMHCDTVMVMMVMKMMINNSMITANSTSALHLVRNRLLNCTSSCLHDGACLLDTSSQPR